MGLAPPEQKEKKSCLRCEIEFKEPETGKPSEYVPQFKQLDGGAQTLEGYICREQKYCRARCFKKATGINPIGPYADISRDYWLFNMDPRPDDWEKVKWRPVPGLKLRERAMAAIVYHSWCFPVCLPFACQINHRDDDIEMLAGEPVHLTRELLAKILGAPQPHVWAACEALVLQGRLFIDEYGVLWPRMHPSLALKDRGGEFQAERRNKGDKYLDPIAKELTAAGYASGDPACRAAFDDARHVRKIFTDNLASLRRAEKAGYLQITNNIKSGLYKTRVYESAETACTNGESGEYNGSHLIVSSSASNTVRTYARASATTAQPPPAASLPHECAQENPCNQQYGEIAETPESREDASTEFIPPAPYSVRDGILLFTTVRVFQERFEKQLFGINPVSADNPRDRAWAREFLVALDGADLEDCLRECAVLLNLDPNSLGKLPPAPGKPFQPRSVRILIGWARNYRKKHGRNYGQSAHIRAQNGHHAAAAAEARERAAREEHDALERAEEALAAMPHDEQQRRWEVAKQVLKNLEPKWKHLPVHAQNLRIKTRCIQILRDEMAAKNGSGD